MTESDDGTHAPTGDPTDAAPGPEIWSLRHPAHGVLEVAVGKADGLRAVDPGFPRGENSPEKGPSAIPGCVVMRDGEVVARVRQIGHHKVSLTADPPGTGKFTTGLNALSGQRILVRSSMTHTEARQVTFRDGAEIVHFDPPPGSAAEARLAAIEASPWKRVVYPMAAGVGRSGWALAMIVLVPILGRLLSPVLDWIAERIPDVDIPWPDIPWPDLPSIPWPDISLPSITRPEFDVPGWVDFLIEYSKVWVPLLIGVGLAVVAVRHSRRSRRIRQQWESGPPPERSDRGTD